jgi:hypothetical protein
VAKPQNASIVRGQAIALMQTCTTVLRSRHAQATPDPRITALAVTILDAAKAVAPNNEILASLEVEKGSWPVLLSAMHAVIQATQG